MNSIQVALNNFESGKLKKLLPKQAEPWMPYDMTIMRTGNRKITF